MLEKIERRRQDREKIFNNIKDLRIDVSTKIFIILLVSESIDDYIEHRIKSDKVIEGILKDIQANTDSIMI